jgi:hypothetical protein
MAVITDFLVGKRIQTEGTLAWVQTERLSSSFLDGVKENPEYIFLFYISNTE